MSQMCRRELLRRSVLVSGAAVAAGVLLEPRDSAAAAVDSRWEIPQLPGGGELLGSALSQTGKVLYAAVRAGQTTTVHTVGIGGTSWSSAPVVGGTDREDASFAVVGAHLVLAGARRRKLRERRVGVHLDGAGLQVPAGDPTKPGGLGGVVDNAEILVEDWTRSPCIAVSSDEGRTWRELTSPRLAMLNSWYTQVVPLSTRGSREVLAVGSANDEPGLLDGYETVALIVDVATGATRAAPTLPPLQEGSWTAAAGGSEVLVAGRDTNGVHLLRLRDTRWEPVECPAAGPGSSIVALGSESSGGLQVAALDSEGRPRMWSTSSVARPNWSERAVPIGIAVGSHARSIVEIEGGHATVFATRAGSPIVATGSG